MARRRYSRFHSWAPYVPVAERRANAARTVAALRKAGHVLAPISISGRNIAKTFWGKAWCANLEAYSDYENRLPRGRTYARNGSVIDLQIASGKVTALVSGSDIYTVEVAIKPLPARRWKKLCGECAGGIDSLVELLAGRFSEGVMEILCRRKTGLYPEPREISMSCSCPDWATMCKHVSATLYGIGARLDEQPELLFRLRQVEESELIQAAGSCEDVSAAAELAQGSVLEGEDLSELFGIAMDEAPKKPRAKRRSKKKTRKKSRARTRRKRVSAKELTARGIPHSRIQYWIRTGVLEHSGERGVYFKTGTSDERIAGYISSMEKFKSIQFDGKFVSRSDLKAQGIAASAIYHWLQTGVLKRSRRRGFFRTTATTASRIKAYLIRE